MYILKAASSSCSCDSANVLHSPLFSPIHAPSRAPSCRVCRLASYWPRDSFISLSLFCMLYKCQRSGINCWYIASRMRGTESGMCTRTRNDPLGHHSSANNTSYMHTTHARAQWRIIPGKRMHAVSMCYHLEMKRARLLLIIKQQNWKSLHQVSCWNHSYIIIISVTSYCRKYYYTTSLGKLLGVIIQV